MILSLKLDIAILNRLLSKLQLLFCEGDVLGKRCMLPYTDISFWSTFLSISLLETNMKSSASIKPTKGKTLKFTQAQIHKDFEVATGITVFLPWM